MSDVYEVLAELTRDIPADSLSTVARRLLMGQDEDLAWGNSLVTRSVVQDFRAAVGEAGLSAREQAIALKSAAVSAEHIRHENEIEILWTGPRSQAVPVRRLEQAFCELVDSALSQLFIASFVAYKADKIYASIQDALERRVRVMFLTEASKEQGGSLESDPTEHLRKKFPQAEFYHWENGSKSAVVHVKCAIADRYRALVASANLTGAAMDENMELGLMTKGPQIARRLVAHFDALITEGILRRI
jgi:cardiolipin synthase A/B